MDTGKCISTLSYLGTPSYLAVGSLVSWDGFFMASKLVADFTKLQSLFISFIYVNSASEYFLLINKACLFNNQLVINLQRLKSLRAPEVCLNSSNS